MATAEARDLPARHKSVQCGYRMMDWPRSQQHNCDQKASNSLRIFKCLAHGDQT